jgi:hypothetical protein
MTNTETLRITTPLSGFIEIWRTSRTTGEKELLLEKQNLILKGAAKIVTSCLAGLPDSKIHGMYIGFNNNQAGFTPKAIDTDYTNKFYNYSGDFGCLREKLTFPATFLASAGYENFQNTVLFSTIITTSSSVRGAAFNEDSQIHEVALFNAPNENDIAEDLIFSRTNFNPIVYNSSYNFTITWGIRIIVPEPEA